MNEHRSSQPAPGPRSVAPARAPPPKPNPAERARILAEKVLAHCEKYREVTTRKGAKTFQVAVTPKGLKVSRPAEEAFTFSRGDLERVLRAILELRAMRAPMTAANLQTQGVGPEGLYIWGILGHMKAQ